MTARQRCHRHPHPRRRRRRHGTPVGRGAGRGPRAARRPRRSPDRGPRRAGPSPGRRGREHRRTPATPPWRPAPTSSAAARTSTTTPTAPTRSCSRSPADHGRTVDLHTDETLDPCVLDLRRPRGPRGDSRASPTGWRPATASASACSRRAAARGGRGGRRPPASASVTLPQTNLFLQARDVPVAPPRGLTAIRAAPRRRAPRWRPGPTTSRTRSTPSGRATRWRRPP